jgi:Glycosyl transferase family 11
MIIILDESGRLGNKLNLFAHFIAFSLKHDIPIAFPGFTPYKHLFESTRNNSFCRIPCPSSHVDIKTAWTMKLLLYLDLLQKYTRMAPCTTNIFACSKREYFDLSLFKSTQLFGSHSFTFAHGYFFRYFDGVQKYGAKIRQILAPIQEYRELAEGCLASAHKNADIIIGIHIRHGDYASWQQGQHFFTITQYWKIMQSLQDLFEPQRVSYIVSSDAEWTSNDFPGLNVIFADREPIVALHSLSLCDYLVGPKSSFNRWASFYGNVPLYTIQDPKSVITRTDFRVNYLDDLAAILDQP